MKEESVQTVFKKSSMENMGLNLGLEGQLDLDKEKVRKGLEPKGIKL